MQVREPRMDDNRASAADNLRKFLLAAWAVRNFFSTVVSYEKFNFRLFHCVQPTKIITFGSQTNIAFGPKTKSCRRARQFFSQSLFLIAFLQVVLGGGREGRPFVICEGQTQTHRHTQKYRSWFQFVYV